MKAEVRQRILSLREQSLPADRHDDRRRAALRRLDRRRLRPRDAVEEFEEFVKEHHDEYLALQAYYERPYRLRPSYDDLKELAEAIGKPPLDLTAGEALGRLRGRRTRTRSRAPGCAGR